MWIVRNPEDGELECIGRDPALDGKEGWEVVETGVTRPRGHCIRDTIGGRRAWRVDREMEETGAAEAMPKRVIYMMLDARILALEVDNAQLRDQIAALTARLDQMEALAQKDA